MEKEQLDAMFDAAHSFHTGNASTAWAQGLETLQAWLEAQKSNRSFIGAQKTSSTIPKSVLAERIYNMGHDLCMMPQRVGRPECNQFLISPGTSRPSAQSGQPIALPVEHVHGWGHATSDAQPALRGKSASMRLKWRPVTSFNVGSDDKIVSFARENLVNVSWQGMAPKVGCITTVSSRVNSPSQLKNAVDNFKLQSYEGTKQLVLVYHNADVEAQHLIAKHADGVFVKGVAARGDGEFPSTIAWRFGAWSTDADIIARWDIDDHHHAQQLSMQVRALVAASRPASVLSLHEDKPANITTACNGRSLIGEVAWMKKNWHPLLPEEEKGLQSALWSQIALVRVPEMLTHGWHPESPSVDAEEHWTMHDQQGSAKDRCLAMLNRSHPISPDSEQVLESKIGEEVGADLQKDYHRIDKVRLGVKDLLVSLCKEVIAEGVPASDSNLQQQASRMLNLYAKLSDHFEVVSSAFMR